MINEKAKWIWISDNPKRNEYAIFEEQLSYRGGDAIFTLCAETDYVLYVNGTVASFGQFAGYPFIKYYDEINITDLLKAGNNRLTVSVRYEGVNSATHVDDGAGVIYSCTVDGALALHSSADTLCGYDKRYVQNTERAITTQLGLASDMRWEVGIADRKSVEITKTLNIKKRPVKKPEILGFVSAHPISEGSHIYDLGREEAGYLCIQIRAASPCNLKVAYGEHVADGCVRYRIGNRDFSLNFELAPGECEFVQYFVRIAGRYLQVFMPEGAQLLSIGIIPTLYPLTERESGLTGLDREIYDTCVRTLRLCMNAHYEDCPWREQALYVMDSRNQMLCGYYAFEETEFQRAMLAFISYGKRHDGFLELTYPAVNTPAIPFFSVMYPVAVYEYVKHTGDTALIDEVKDTMLGIMNATGQRIGGCGLIKDFEKDFWNFYEWSPYSDGGSDRDGSSDREDYHLILNCAYVYSAERLRELCPEFDADTERIKKAITDQLFDEKTGLFAVSLKEKDKYSQLGNAFALLIGLGNEKTLAAVKKSDSLIPATLSMLPFVYDALIKCDPTGNDFVISDIREKYGYMLSCGATSFWETIEGERAFSKAGSLCHGWSAIPIYYLAKK